MTSSDNGGRWYLARTNCTAKWFADLQQMPCPRCGSDSRAVERLVPPWLSHQLTDNASEKRTDSINVERKTP